MKAKKNMMIGILCIALVFMGLGYSLYSSTLNLNGDLSIPNTVEYIGSSAFYNNKITTLNLSPSLEYLGSSAFSNNYDENDNLTLTTINLNMTSSEWSNRNLPVNNWYSGEPTVNTLD